MMKTNKVTKLGISLLSVAALGVVAPILIDVPVFGVSIVKAEETRPLEYLIVYYDKDTGEEIAPPKTGTINPGEIVNIYKDIDGYQVVSNYEWMPGFNASYRIMSEYFGFSKGRLFMFLDYKKVNADAKPSDTPKPEEKPETKPSETPKPEVKPETKPSETPKPEVKPEPAPKEEEKQEPLKYRITYYDIETRETLGQMTGVINPGQTINIYKKFNGHEIISKDSWMPNYDMTYDIVNEYFYGSADGYNDLRLEYKKLDADAKPSDTSKPEVKPETKPSDTPKPEVKPEPNPSETPKPEVKPEPKPSDTPKPEVKPEPKPSETPKPEVKPEPKPSETPKPEVKPEPAPTPDPSKEKEKEDPTPNPAPTPDPGKEKEKPAKPDQGQGQQDPNKLDPKDSAPNPDKQDQESEVREPEKKLPNTGEQNSILGFAGFLLASLGLAGLTYKGRH